MKKRSSNTTCYSFWIGSYLPDGVIMKDEKRWNHRLEGDWSDGAKIWDL